jgi:hypothetical protein
LTAFKTQEPKVLRRRGLLLVWLGSQVFFEWKHSFVRPDWYHLEFFLAFAPILALGLEALPCEQTQAKAWGRGLGVACCVFALVTSEWRFFPGYLRFCTERTCRVVPNNLRNLVNPNNYWQEMNAALEVERRQGLLPKINQQIGKASVDVFGNSQVYAVFNHLNYHPRPVFQSEVAVTLPFMKLNEAFYLSRKAPEFVLFRLDPIDFRLPAMEDALVFRDLLINYNLVETEEPFLLLKARQRSSPTLTPLGEGTVRLGEPIALARYGDRPLWLEVGLKSTLAGRLAGFLYKPSAVRMRICDGTGTNSEYSAPAPMVAAGFVANPLVREQTDIVKLYEGRPVARAVSYTLDSPSRWQWQQTLHFRVYGIQNSLGNCREQVEKSTTCPNGGQCSQGMVILARFEPVSTLVPVLAP